MSVQTAMFPPLWELVIRTLWPARTLWSLVADLSPCLHGPQVQLVQVLVSELMTSTLSSLHSFVDRRTKTLGFGALDEFRRTFWVMVLLEDPVTTLNNLTPQNYILINFFPLRFHAQVPCAWSYKTTLQHDNPASMLHCGNLHQVQLHI